MPFSVFLANKLLDVSTGKTAYTPPTVYVGLSSTTPVVAGTSVTEPSTGAYARVATSGATWNAAASGSTSNASSITFPTATADWAAGSNMTHFVLYDASTAGNFLGFGALTTAKAILNGDTASFAAAALTATLS
jgi:hypothetical protein